MGKWTLAHHDEVLQAKFKSLVAGAIKRIKLEHEGPAISYEAFVEELDAGDTFTTTLLEVLVKEMADRRTRTNTPDRRLISERTAKSLRMQTSPIHIYRRRRHASRVVGRPGFNVVYTDLAAELTDDDDEHGDNHSNPSEADTPFEGARINSDLYDAYAPATYPMAMDLLDRLRPSETIPLATGSSDAAELGHNSYSITSPRPLSPVLPSIAYRSSPWAHSSTSAGSATLARQNSLRRPARSRTVDFNEFTNRRRSSIRQNQHDTETVRPEESSDGMWRFRSSPLAQEEPATSMTASSSVNPFPAVRRSFPLSPWGHLRRHQEMGGAFPYSPEPSQSPPHDAGNSDQAAIGSSSGQGSSRLWYSLTSSVTPAPERSTSPPSRRATIADINEARRQVIAPRLRRGGLRAPESLLSRYASPAEDEQTGEQQDATIAGELEEAPESSGPDPSYFDVLTSARDYMREQVASEILEWEGVGEDSRQLPTPARSITPAAET